MPADSTPAARSPQSNGERSAAQHRRSPTCGPLTAAELYQLTLYKWRYSLEALGFGADQVQRLVFLKWLRMSQRIPS